MFASRRVFVSRPYRHGLTATTLFVSALIVVSPRPIVHHQVQAATSSGCEGGGFSIVLPSGTTVSGDQDTTIPAASLGTRFLVRGRYVEFEVISGTFGLGEYALTGAANPEDITGGVRTPIFARKTPNHRGLILTSAVTAEIKGEDLVIERTGNGLSMKIQAKDCATGGVFQMEPERGDGTATDITHVLASGSASLQPFYFDNPNFRAREGDVVPFKDTTVVVTPRVNWANDFSPKFVGRDSPQVATRIAQGCPNQIRKRDGTFVTVDHCGGVSLWRVASGGRMGMVLGEDAVEVAPPATNCTENCQAQNRVRGQAVVLGFPFPVPADSRLQPRFPSGFQP
jgi:hypothetical protein